MKAMNASRCGQSITELLLAIAVAAIFMVAAVAVIVPALRENNQAENIQQGATVAQDLLGNVRVWSESGWSNITALATGTAYQYYLITSSSPYTVTSGVQSIVIGTTTYTRYFYLSDAYRTGGGTVTSTPTGNAYDPSTKQVFVVYNWTHGVTSTMSTYLTRNGDAVIDQTDWSGGPGAGNAATSANSQFASSTNIDYSTTTGALYVSIPGY
jgi:type II secretory pathway pseudopilin PulG